MNSQDEPTGDVWTSARSLLGDGLLSIVMPAHNLGHAIADNVRKVHALFTDLLGVEIIVVDDGSTDNTASELSGLTGAIPELKPVLLDENIGKGGAIKRGFEAATGNFVLFLDADLDLPPQQVSGFFDIMMREQADVVIGSKWHPGSVLNYPHRRKLMSAAYYAFVKMLIGLPIRDTQTGIKLFKREALAWAMPRMLVKRFAFDLELLAIIHENGFKIAESPITLEFQVKWGCVRPSAVKQIMTDTLAIFYRLRLLHYYQSIPETCMPDPPPLVSIVIPYPAITPYLRECVESIHHQTYKNYEIILLPDEASGHTWPETVNEIPTGRIRPAEKRNAGIEHARGEIIAFIDDDAVATPCWLEQAVVYFSDNTIGALGGPAVTHGSDPYMARLSGLVYANRFVSGQYRYRYAPERLRTVDDYPSCNLLVRTEIMRQLGGFRTDFWPGEDTYLCMEIVKTLGRKIIYDPRVTVYHHRRKLFLPHLRQIARYGQHRGYFAKRFPATSRKLSYMLPSMLVLGIILGLPLAIMYYPCRLIYVTVLVSYAFATFVSCTHPRPLTWLITWLGVVLTHMVYGARFIVGLCSTKLPGEVDRFDHPSEDQGKSPA